MGDKTDTLENHSFFGRFDGGSVVVDMGAHTGDFACSFSEKYPFSKIYVVEANPKLMKSMRERFGKDKRIILLNNLIGSEDKNVKFYLREPTISSSIEPVLPNKPQFDNIVKKICCKMISFDKFCRQNGIKKIDLLKMDIECAEWDIFDKFTKNEYGMIDQITVEFHDFIDKKFLKRTHDSIKHLKSLGYSFTYKSKWGMKYFDCLFYKESLLK